MDTKTNNESRTRRWATLLVVAMMAALLAPIVGAGTAGAEFFDPRVPGVGNQAKAVGLGDFNGDGRLRAAMLAPGENYVVTMDPVTMLTDLHTTGGGAVAVIGSHTPVGVGDINGDGRDDLLTHISIGILTYHYWWPGQADGNFGVAALYAGDVGGVSRLAVGEFIGSDADEVFRMYRPNTALSMAVNFRGAAETSNRFSRGQFDVARVRYLVAGDFVAGGDDEVIAFYDYNSHFNGFLYETVQGEVVQRGVAVTQTPWVMAHTKEMVAGDFNGDGIDDVALIEEPTTNRSSVFVMVSNNPDGGLDAPVRAFDLQGAFNADGTRFFGATDVNGDGYEDVIAIHGNRPLRFYGSASGLLTFEPPTVQPELETCNGLVVTVSIARGDQPTAGDDVILGTEGADEIFALGGDDTICALGGNDRIVAGGGRDWVSAGAGDDVVLGGGGLDRLFGEAGDDTISGQRGNDRIKGGPGVDELVGNGGRDRIWGGGDADIIQGGGGNDRLRGNGGNDRIEGNGGRDDIHGGPGSDDCFGGPGVDRLRSC